MPFERSQEIEQRLETVLRLISAGQFSAPMLAEEVGVSIPTISRCVTALRNRGNDIRSLRGNGGWFYVLRINHKAVEQQRGQSPLLTDEKQHEA